MMIHHSLKILSHLSEIESKIRDIEEMLSKMGIEWDQEEILKSLVGQKKPSSWPTNKNLE